MINVNLYKKGFIRREDGFSHDKTDYLRPMKPVFQSSPEILLADTPAPPYYAVIFTSVRTDVDEGYAETAQKMMETAATMPGFLGAESAREEVGITVSYWADEESIQNWKYHIEHVKARDKGREKWYSAYRLRVAKIERDYGFSTPSPKKP